MEPWLSNPAAAAAKGEAAITKNDARVRVKKTNHRMKDDEVDEGEADSEDAAADTINRRR